MTRAMSHYRELGWDVHDVSAQESYDLLCTEVGEDDRRVKVKGTTSSGTEVLLTRNEVANARAVFPAVALVVVAGLDLDRSGSKPVCSGGKLQVLDPWLIESSALCPLAFSYAVPPE